MTLSPVRALLVAALVAVALPAGSQDSTAEAAGRAARRIEEAQAALARAEAAGGSRERLAALTETVRAYEEGLALLRDALRRTALAREALQDRLDADREEIAQLLGVLQSIGTSPEPVLLLHPSGPLGTARAGMILADVTPALQARARALEAQLEEVARLDAAQADAEITLRDGLASAQSARAQLAAAAADRTELPRAYTEDEVATALLLASTATLDAFAEGLGQTVDEVVAPAPEAAPDGGLPLPVEGTVLRRPGEADAAGTVRPGVVIATAPRALVTLPVAATLRFRGPLLDYGTVAIVEPAPGTLIVLAGLAQVFGEAGEVLPAGSPLGLMGGVAPDADAILSDAGAPEATGGAIDRPETLYLEVRDADGPIDPSTWFALP